MAKTGNNSAKAGKTGKRAAAVKTATAAKAASSVRTAAATKRAAAAKSVSSVKKVSSVKAAAKHQTSSLKKRKPTLNPQGRKKTRKGMRHDGWQIVFLTGAIIAASLLVALGVIGFAAATPEEPFAQFSPQAEEDAAVPRDAPSAQGSAVKSQNRPPITEETAVSPGTPQKRETLAAKKPPEKRDVAAIRENAQTVAEKPPVKPPPSPATAAPARGTGPETSVSAKPDIPAAKKPLPVASAAQKPAAPVKKPVPAAVKTPSELPPQPKHQGTLVFIIDDAGNNLEELEPFLRFPGPLTIAVLPGLPHSAEAARRVRAAGKEVFLHQPMEAVGGKNPGPGAIYAGMSAAEIVAVLSQNLAEIGPVAGMNNHQGSKITMDQRIMETVLSFCREQGICFLDSRTTAETAAPAVARNLRIKIGERTVFIDNEQSRTAMNGYIENGLTQAAGKGSAVMIGHTWSPALAPLLAERYQALLSEGYTLATASNFIRK